MRLLQVRENQFINIDAIASVRVDNPEQMRTTPEPYGLQKTEKVGETLAIHIELFNGSKVTLSDQYAHDAYDALFSTPTT